MKNFFTLTLCVLTLSLTAQEPLTYPYNPDEDVNGLIASPDLLGLLGLYGDEFSPAEIMIGDTGLAQWIQILNQTLINQQAAIDSLQASLDSQETQLDSSMIADMISQISDLDHFTSADETDPVFEASIAHGIMALDTANWNNHTVHIDTQIFNGNAITTWSELDLSNLIGTTKSLVFLKVTNNIEDPDIPDSLSTSGHCRFLFREKGDNATYKANNDPGINYTSLNHGYSGQIMVRTNNDGIIEWISTDPYSCIIELITYIK
jgi:hypothetical protein